MGGEGPVDVSDARRRGRWSGGVGRGSSEGDKAAVLVVAEAVALVARAVAAVSLVVDPDLVVLGGGTGSAPGFGEAVAVELRRLLPTFPDVRVSAIGAESVVDGGFRLGTHRAWRRVLDP